MIPLNPLEAYLAHKLGLVQRPVTVESAGRYWDYQGKMASGGLEAENYVT